MENNCLTCEALADLRAEIGSLKAKVNALDILNEGLPRIPDQQAEIDMLREALLRIITTYKLGPNEEELDFAIYNAEGILNSKTRPVGVKG